MTTTTKAERLGKMTPADRDDWMEAHRDEWMSLKNSDDQQVIGLDDESALVLSFLTVDGVKKTLIQPGRMSGWPKAD